MMVTQTVDMSTMDYCVLQFKSPFRLSHTEIGAIDISETAAGIPLLLLRVLRYVIAAMPLSLNGRNIPWESAVAKFGHKSEAVSFDWSPLPRAEEHVTICSRV